MPLFRDAPLAFECSSHEGVRVCVTPPHRSLASSYAKPAQRVLSVLPQTVVSRDVLLAESGYQTYRGQRVIDLGRPTSHGSRQQMSDLTGEGLAQSFSGRDACAFMRETGGSELTSQQMGPSMASIPWNVPFFGWLDFSMMMRRVRNEMALTAWM